MDVTTSPIFSVTISIPGRTARPFRVTEVDAHRAAQVVASFLAAWGIPMPSDVRDEETLAQRLGNRGDYRCDVDNYWIIVERGAR